MSHDRCWHCGLYHEMETCCWRIRAVEFNDDGSVKRVEYWEPRAVAIAAPAKLEMVN